MADASATGESGDTRRQPPRALFGVVNPIMRGLLRSPLHGLVSRRLLLLEVTGRKSGRIYSVPIGYVPVGDALYLGTDGRWVRNLRGGAEVRVWLRGRPVAARAEVIDDPDGMAAAYRTMIPGAPQFGQMFGLALDAEGQVDRAAVERLRGAGHVVVRVRPVQGA